MENENSMDDAALKAAEELKVGINTWSAKDLAAWWARWYLTAGHKRLGRALVQLHRASDKKED